MTLKVHNKAHLVMREIAVLQRGFFVSEESAFYVQCARVNIIRDRAPAVSHKAQICASPDVEMRVGFRPLSSVSIGATRPWLQPCKSV